MPSTPPPPPPPPSPFPFPSSFNDPNPHSSIQSINPSILITILIISLTIIISLSLCLLLRLLRNRRHISPSIPPPDSFRLFSHRISPEIHPPPLLDSLPLFTFSSITRRPSSATSPGDCSVCLSKFEPHDQLRLLPLCCHAFHVECIDTWLQSNQTCPLCRTQIHATESDLIKALIESSAITDNGGRSDSFRLELGSISRRQGVSDSGRETRRSYSVGSFDYVVEEDSEITMNHTHRRSVSDKEQFGAMEINAAAEQNLAAEVASGRSWLKDYVDRLSVSLSSRALSFRSSGRFFTGSSRRTEVSGVGECDLEANHIGDEIGELFRWFSGV